MGEAAEWLRLARIDRVLDYAWPEEQARDAFLRKIGFRQLTRNERGWRRRSQIIEGLPGASISACGPVGVCAPPGVQ